MKLTKHHKYFSASVQSYDGNYSKLDYKISVCGRQQNLTLNDTEMTDLNIIIYRWLL